MTRNRIVALSTIVLIASGGLIFACSGDDSGTDGGTDAKADQTGNKDSGTDAGKDGSPFQDGGQDATIQDSGTDATLQDAATDATETDAAETDADASDDGAVNDASLDGGALTFMVLRVGGDVDAGADAAATSGTAYALYLEQRNVSDGSLVNTIALPTAVNGNDQPVTLTGSSTAEGSLTTSADGHYVVLAGYGAVPGTASVSSAGADAGTPRVVARVDKSGSVDTTTELFAFNKVSIRGAASNDGTAFWATGSANDGTPYVALGSTGGFTDLDSTLANTRVVQIFGGQVYVSAQSGAFHGISTVGTGLPTTSGQTVALLPGIPGDAGSAYGFSMLDQDASVTGLDVLYVADDETAVNGGGIQKWVYNGTTWAKIATFNDGATNGCRGVTAYISGSDIVVIASTADGTPNKVIKYVDDGTNTSPTATVLATAPTNTIFRGVALSPQ